MEFWDLLKGLWESWGRASQLRTGRAPFPWDEAAAHVNSMSEVELHHPSPFLVGFVMLMLRTYVFGVGRGVGVEGTRHHLGRRPRSLGGRVVGLGGSLVLGANLGDLGGRRLPWRRQKRWGMSAVAMRGRTASSQKCSCALHRKEAESELLTTTMRR